MDERPSWDRPDEDDDAVGTDAPTEGVRIIGAEEAAEAVERQGAGSRRAEGMPRYGDRPEGLPADTERPALRFPLSSAGAEAGDQPRPRVSGSPAPSLPHWTDPPTGEVPRILADPAGRAESDAEPDDGDGEELDAWSGLGTGPRWRDAAPGDWDDDTGTGLVHDEETRIGALDDRDRPHPDDPFGFEDDLDDEPFAPPPSRRERRPAAVDLDLDLDEEDEAPPRARREAAPATAPRQGRRRPSPTAPGRSAERTPARGTDRDLRVAIGVGVGLAVAAIVSMTLGPGWGVALATVIVTLCVAELFDAIQKAGYQPATLLGLVATAALVTSAYWKGEAAIPLVLALTVVFTLLWYLAGVSRSEPSANAGVTVLAVAYVGLFGCFAALMLRLPNGTGILLGTVLAVVASDVGALFVGRRFGRAPLAADISPNKTVEGTLGGAVAAIVVSYVVLDLVGLHPWEAKGGSALALGAVVAVLAPLGDLVESMIKRDLDVKDMGSILPGHGGLIDRFDSLLFVLPAAYYLTRLLEIA